MKSSYCFLCAMLIDLTSGLFFGGGYGGGITYQLYTRRNPVNGQALTIGNRNSLAYSNYDSSKPTR